MIFESFLCLSKNSGFCLYLGADGTFVRCEYLEIKQQDIET